jgi:uroporphyrinogen-III synthase
MAKRQARVSKPSQVLRGSGMLWPTGRASLHGMTLPPLAGYTVGVTADRRRDELAGLLSRRGARVVHGPSLATEYLHDDATLRAATADLICRPPQAVVAVTGIGIRAWFQAAETWGSGDDLRMALASARILARGPKAAAAISAAGLTVTRQAQNEQLDEISAALLEEGVAGERVAVQLHGDDGLDLCATLRDAGADVVEVPVYRWRPPADPAPALRLVDAACDRRLDAVVFTSAPAVRGLFALAATAGTEETLRAAFRGDLVAACVGPVCAAAAREEGVEAPVWPAVGRLGTLVRALSDHLAGRRREFMLTGVPVTLQGSLAVVDGETVELPARERAVLAALAGEPGAIVARDVLLQQVWGSDATDPHILETTVARLRRRLGAAGRGIVSCRGRGYRLDPGS